MHKIKSKIHIRQRTAPERKMQTIVIFNPVATLNIVEQRVETRTCNLNFTNRVCTSVIVCTSRSSFSRGVSHSVRIDGTLSGSSDQSCRGMQISATETDALFFRGKSRSDNGPFHRLLALYPATGSSRCQSLSDSSCCLVSSTARPVDYTPVPLLFGLIITRI